MIDIILAHYIDGWLDRSVSMAFQINNFTFDAILSMALARQYMNSELSEMDLLVTNLNRRVCVACSGPACNH